MAVRAKESRYAEVPCLAAEASVVTERSGDRGNCDTGLRIHEADAGIVAGLGDRVISTDCSEGDVGDGVKHGHIEANAIRNVVEAIGGIDPADIEYVEGAAGLAVAVVLGHQHDIDQADGPFLVRAAGGTVRGASAIVRDQSRGEDNRESYKGQHFRSHRISSNDVCRGPDYAFNKLSRS